MKLSKLNVDRIKAYLSEMLAYFDFSGPYCTFQCKWVLTQDKGLTWRGRL